MRKQASKGFRWVVLYAMVAMLLPAMTLKANAADAVVSDYNELVAAIESVPDGGTIAITQDITTLERIILGKSFTFQSADPQSPVTIYSPSARHFRIKATDDILLRFESVILDGDGTKGGIDINGTDTTLENIVVQNCSVSSSSGAVYCTGGDLTIVGDSKIADNSGRGIYVAKAGLVNIRVIGAQVSNNNKGGIISQNQASLLVEDCQIFGNHASSAGGIYSAYTPTTIRGSTITGNTSTTKNMGHQSGGGVFAGYSTLTIEDSTISNNTAGALGGGVHTLSDTVIRDSIITENSAQSGGGIGLSIDISYYLPMVEIRGNSVVANNTADQAYYMTDPDDIALHNRQIDSTVTWTRGFDYAYNNMDISYDKGLTEPPEPTNTHNVTVITKYRDGALPDHTETYRVPHGTAFSEPFAILDGYKLYNVSLRSFEYGVDMDSKLVFISNVERDYTITLEFYRPTHNVTVIVRYEDDALEESVTTYAVPYGDSFDETFAVLDGYEVVRVSASTFGVDVGAVEHTIHCDAVNEPMTVTIVLGKR